MQLLVDAEQELLLRSSTDLVLKTKTLINPVTLTGNFTSIERNGFRLLPSSLEQKTVDC